MSFWTADGDDNGVFNSEDGYLQTIGQVPHAECKRLQKRNGLDPARGGEQVSNPTYMSDRKGHNGITQDGTATTLNAQEKERPIIGEKKDGGDAMTSVVRRLTPLE